jgi:hypothetical protein
MDDRQFSAIESVAADGVDFDGLVVERVDDAYTVQTPESDRSGLTSGDLRATLADQPHYVSNWYFWHQRAPQAAASWQFLRWLESAADTAVPERYERLREGIEQTWGELLITITLGETGERRYDLRHEADADVPADALDAYTEPRDARDVAKLDADGRYRPLKTAPSLADGWVFDDLDPAALVETVDFFYPATISNWHREREGDLDVTHYRETAERQTGIYSVIEELPPEAVEWVAEATCVDSQCLKRREWDEDAETELEVPRGDGPFPCREPCSLVIAAARKWTTLEDESTRTYEFELTPSEKTQLEGLIDAVADGRVDDIREADVYEDANRYRARYLRAKRFDDDGNLGGVPTIPDAE